MNNEVTWAYPGGDPTEKRPRSARRNGEDQQLLVESTLKIVRDLYRLRERHSRSLLIRSLGRQLLRMGLSA
jgi:hypothetical protein